MKRVCSPSLMMDSNTVECITRFQLIPPNLVTKDNPIFSAFSKPKPRRFHILDHHDHNNLPPQLIHHQPKSKNQSNYSSLLLHKGKQQTNIFEGLLKARKSQMKKIKLKQFYLEDYTDQRITLDQSVIINDEKDNAIQSKNSTEFNTIDQKHSETYQKKFFIPSRKRLLPAKLRAQSYSNIPKNYRDRSIESRNENSLYVKAKKSHAVVNSEKLVHFSIDHQVIPTENSIKANGRRNLRTGKVRKISQFDQKPLKELQDITLQMNQQASIYCNSQKDIKRGFQRHYKHRRNIKSQNITQLDSALDIDPWAHNHNEENKENQFYIYV